MFHSCFQKPCLRIRIFALGLISLFALTHSAYAKPGETALDELEAGFHQMYNLDFSGAHKTFQSWQELYPDDPMGAVSNAAAYLFSEFQRMHVLNLELFTGRGLKDVKGVSPDPHIKAAFDAELVRADELSAKALAQSAEDRNALFAKSLAEGLRGNYQALVEKRNGDALDFLKSSRTIAEKLIAIDPGYYDAYLAIGIENYLLSLRSGPTRWFLRMSGAQTSKEKGIPNLRITADKGRFLAPYARLLLVIAALREKDLSTAKDLLTSLARDFPHNPLYLSELSRLINNR
jgi:hypothetical protein